MLYGVVGTKFGKVQSKNYNLKSWICSANLNLRNRMPPVSASLQMWRNVDFPGITWSRSSLRVWGDGGVLFGSRTSGTTVMFHKGLEER